MIWGYPWVPHFRKPPYTPKMIFMIASFRVPVSSFNHFQPTFFLHIICISSDRCSNLVMSISSGMALVPSSQHLQKWYENWEPLWVQAAACVQKSLSWWKAPGGMFFFFFFYYFFPENLPEKPSKHCRPRVGVFSIFCGSNNEPHATNHPLDIPP